MGNQIKTKGIVLHEMPIGDYDKRLILLTKEQGKVTAFVKGARRSNSKMLAMTQLFAYGDYVLSQGKTSYNVYQAQLIESFHQLRQDVAQLTYGMYMLEFADYVAREEEENKVLMHWLLLSLNVLDKGRIDARLVIRIFELKAMSIIGYNPWLDDCVQCHEEEVAFFSPEAGGVVCHNQGHGIKDLIKIHEGTLHAMRFILTQPMKEIYRFRLEQTELQALEMIMIQYIQHQLDHRFKTLEFLKQL